MRASQSWAGDAAGRRSGSSGDKVWIGGSELRVGSSGGGFISEGSLKDWANEGRERVAGVRAGRGLMVVVLFEDIASGREEVDWAERRRSARWSGEERL